MNCINCGALLTDLDYCGHCGCNVLVQKKAYYLSNVYYNQGLEKASIRDLSGAISCLQRSLTFNKHNIQARNLLGLVFFETGEVVSALSEWVISKNLRPIKNQAAEYIEKVQANPNKLESINESIRKYNQALEMCREGHEDVAAIQLKKILAQNPKLIKGYHLLGLIQIKHGAYNKARRTLKKAARIDKTNTTTLRFLREVDEQTGVTTKLEEKRKGRKKEIPDERENRSVVYQSGNDIVIQPPAYRENTMMSTLINMGVGFAIGAAALWFLVVPSIRQGIYREANEQIVDYSESMASQSAELSRAQSELEYSDSEKKEVQTQITQAQKESESYEALLAAYKAYQEKDMDEAAAQLQKVYVSSLSESASGIYSIISNETGATGIVDDEAASDEGQSDGDSSDEDSQDTSGYDDYGDYDADYQDEGSDWYTGEE